MNALNTATIKKDFSVFAHHKELVYLDTAASALTPTPVIAALRAYYEEFPANIARGIYALSERATQEYEHARADVARFIGAQPHDVVFTSGTTHALNMVGYGLEHTLPRKANIVVTAMDHHANFVPWQQLAARTGADFRVIAVTADGTLDLDDLRTKVDHKTAVFAFPFVSNVLGTINPVRDITALVKRINPRAHTVIDAAQAVAHLPLDVTTLGCDFLAFSGHKLYGPTGIGVLWGRTDALATLTPLLTGGEMVSAVSCARTTFKDLPHRLEAGTPPIAQAIGLGASVRYLTTIGIDTITVHDHTMITYAQTQLQRTCGDVLTLYGPPTAHKHSGLISFSLADIHPHDIAHILDTEHSIAIRAGAHCAQPLHDILGIGATARVSFGIYTTRADIDRLINALQTVTDIFYTNS